MEEITKSRERLTPKFLLLRALADRIIAEKKNDAPYLIGVDGVTGAGKTTFAEGLAAILAERGKQVVTIHVDDFLNPKSVRYGGDERTDFYNRSFNIKRLHEILRKIRSKGEMHETFTFLNAQTDTMDVERTYDITPDTCVIVEGMFVQREILRDYFDLKLYIDTATDEAKQRAHERNAAGPNDREQWSPGELDRKYEEKLLPGFARYEKASNPLGESTILIDNTDLEHPRVLASVSRRV